MSAPIQPLRSLLEQAGAARDEALAAHQHSQQALLAAQAQAEQLVAYRRDYAVRYGPRPQSEGSVELMRCYQGFMARLEDAIAQQRHVVAQAEQRAQVARADLLAAELRMASVGKVIDRREAEAALRGERLEQKQIDELASRAAWHARARQDAPPRLGS